MKKECVSRSFKLKQNTGSLSRAVSWINFSSLSRQTKRLFRSDGELSSMCVQQVDEDDENWTYRSQHRKGDSLFLIPPVGAAACQLVPGQCPCPGPTGSPELLARELQEGWEEEDEEGSTKPRHSTALPSFSWVKTLEAYGNQLEKPLISYMGDIRVLAVGCGGKVGLCSLELVVASGRSFGQVLQEALLSLCGTKSCLRLLL